MLQERSKNRVVITGIGALTPIGNNKDEFAKSLYEGKDGINLIKGFDISQYRFKTGGELKEFYPENYFTKKELRRMDRATQMALIVGNEAVCDSGVDLTKIDSHRCGIITGTTLGGMISGERYYREVMKRRDRVYASLLLDQPLYTASESLASRYNFAGINNVISTACSASAHAIGYGFELIREGIYDLLIVGGVDTMSQLTLAGFGILQAITKEKIRPFDKNRSGLVLGESAGMIVMEELMHAKSRNARIYCEIIGYGKSSDAYHMTAPDKEGKGAYQAMKMAIKRSQIKKEEMDYINAHGTGTKHNDAAETLAIKKLFEEFAYKIPVSSIKSMIGHTLGAAGAIEAIACILALRDNFIPPTINYETPDPECDLDYVPNVSRKKDLNTVMSNSFGFGGNNASLLFKRYVN
jgi:3-oxoacyl-[acyl-carrier-protein] synthase II